MTRTKELTNFHYVNITNKGRIRTNNEDYLGYFDTINGHVFVVCDGIGGLPYGEKASQTVVNAVKFFFSNFFYKDPFQAINDALAYANTRIDEEARTNKSYQGMGTTVVLALIRYNKVYYAHLGDSRIYYLHNQQLTKLTTDDSYVEQLLYQGKISADEAKNHPRKNELTAAMGLFGKPHICSSPITPTEKELLLLCTDGLYNMVNEKELQNILTRRGHIEDKANEMLKTALDNGGLDNITLQLIKFYNIEPTNSTPTEVNTTKPIRNHKKSIVIILEIIIAILITIGIITLRFNNNNNLEHNQNQPTQQVISIINQNNYNIDSLSALYNVKIEDIVIYSKAGKYMINIPVKTVFKSRYYDNIYTLSTLYNVSQKRLITINQINNNHIIPGSTIIIPY